MGTLGPQTIGTDNPVLESVFYGSLGSLGVVGDVKGVRISLDTAFENQTVNVFNVGGSWIGGSTLRSGYIFADQIRTLRVGGSIVGGTGVESGVIRSSSGGETVNIGGDVRGGTKWAPY